VKKYEIHLPLKYGNGKPIEQEKIRRVREELLAEFGSFAVPQERVWKQDSVTRVEIMKFEILTEDRITKERLKDLSTRLKESLRQIDILITAHRIQVI
jgi:hypothetical protein